MTDIALTGTGTGTRPPRVRLHRPLTVVAGLMAACALVSIGGLLLDPHRIVGAPAWAKPLKFSLSILLYAITWAWLIAHLPRWQRIARGAGTVMAVALVIEQTAIVWAVTQGTTSHFNVSDSLHTAIWAAMAIAITVLYLCTFITSIAVFFLPLPTPSLTLAVRAGAIIALAGIGVAFLMTSPTAGQLSDFKGIAGAHTVGAADGGPGLPILGWSTVAGDYRVPHFFGMHALQVLPLFAIALTWIGARVPALAPDSIRHRVVLIAAVGFAAALVLLTLEAAAGRPVTHPSPVCAIVGVALVGAVAAAIVLAVFRRGAARS